MIEYASYIINPEYRSQHPNLNHNSGWYNQNQLIVTTNINEVTCLLLHNDIKMLVSHAASARDAKRPLPENSNFLAPQICPIVLFGVDPVFSVTTSTVPRPL